MTLRGDRQLSRPEISTIASRISSTLQYVCFPARAYRPKDKALVEGAVEIIYPTIFTKIDEKVYTSLETLNGDILFLFRNS